MPLLILLLALTLAALQRPRRPEKMPRRHPRVAHFMPYLFGDSLRALRVAKRLRFKYIDQNGQVDANGVVWIVHWALIRRSWKWWWTGEYDAKGREIRVRVPGRISRRKIENVDTDTMRRLRSKKRGGTRPYTAEQHMAVAAQVGIILCLEAKGSLAFLTDEPWAYLERAAIATGAVVIIMTLTNLHRRGRPGDPYTRALLALAHGFPVAVLPRTPKPNGWEKFYGDRIEVWGRWR